MKNLFYLFEPTLIRGSKYAICALSKDGSPHGIISGGFIGDESHDVTNSTSLISLFTRMEENGGNPPDFQDFADARKEAVKKGEAIYGKGFFMPES